MSEATISYGLLLFNKEKQILAIERIFSYGFSSIMSILVLKGTTATGPNQLKSICEQLLRECTESEFELFNKNWSREGIHKIIEIYLDKLEKHEYLKRAAKNIEKELKKKSIQVQAIWNDLLISIDIKTLKPTGEYRLHDFPKGRRCRSLKQVRHHFEVETQIKLPEYTKYGKSYYVKYKSTTGINYQILLYSAYCDKLKLPQDHIEWISIADLKIHPKILDIVQSASKE